MSADPNEWLWREGKRLVELDKADSHLWRIVIVFKDGTTALGECDAFYKIQDTLLELMTEKKTVALINIW